MLQNLNGNRGGISDNEWLCDRFNVAKPSLYFPNGFLRGSIPRWEQKFKKNATKLI